MPAGVVPVRFQCQNRRVPKRHGGQIVCQSSPVDVACSSKKSLRLILVVALGIARDRSAVVNLKLLFICNGLARRKKEHFQKIYSEHFFMFLEGPFVLRTCGVTL